MALSLANKLGIKHGLLAFSLHPGVILTNLGSHLDWDDVDVKGLCMLALWWDCPTYFWSNSRLGSTDRRLGNAEGWKTSFDFKTPERGVATHVYASFDPLLKGMCIFANWFQIIGWHTIKPANNGAYLIDSHIADPLQDTLKPWTTSEFEAERLWRLSEKLVGEEFPY